MQSFGYGLYLTPELDRSKSKPNPELETKEHRVRCDKFGKSVIVAQEVKPAGGLEYLVHFIHEPTKVSLFGKTHNGAIEGLALFDDLKKAHSRWLGKTIYSWRRFINLYDSSTGNVKTQKVKICDPLRVNEIQWGTTPLPLQPLWLMVETPQGIRGFVPVWVSWANVMYSKITGNAPWEEEITEKDPKTLFSWDNAVWEAIDNHSVIFGMTRKQVLISWGFPKGILKDTIANKSGERWIFEDDQDIRFIGDSLASIGVNKY